MKKKLLLASVIFIILPQLLVAQVTSFKLLNFTTPIDSNTVEVDGKFQTTEIVKYNYLKSIISDLNQEITLLENYLDQNSKGIPDTYHRKYDLEELENEIIQMKRIISQIDSLSNVELTMMDNLKKYEEPEVFECFYILKSIQEQNVVILETKNLLLQNSKGLPVAGYKKFTDLEIDDLNDQITNAKANILKLEQKKSDLISKLADKNIVEAYQLINIQNRKEKLADNVKVIKAEIVRHRKGEDATKYVQISSFRKDYLNSLIGRKKDSINMIYKQRDSLYHIYTKDYLAYKKTNVFLSRQQVLAYYDMMYGENSRRFKTLTSSGFSFGDNTSSVYTELVSGNFGVVRVGLGTMISTNSSSNDSIVKKEEAFQRLANLGGNTVLKAEYPFVYLHNKSNRYNFISRLTSRGSADFKEFGTTTEDWAGSFMLGLDIYADASSSNNDLRFFLSGNMNKVYGTDIFKDNLGTKSNNFFFGQLTVGIIVLENIKLSFNLFTLSDEKVLRKQDVIIGGQVLH